MTTTVPAILPRVTVQDDGGESIIGDPESGQFVSVPDVGGVVVRSLQAGRSVDETKTAAEAFAGEPVDVEALIETLVELGFTTTAQAHEVTVSPTRSAPVQQRGWVTGISEQMTRPLFGTVAWTGYSLALVAALVIFGVRPDLLPRSTDAIVVSDVGLSAVIVVPIAWLLTVVHEAWHWLAVRALGLRARFALDVRFGVFLVAETDLSQIWGVPRRQRYGPLLAGLAVDAVMLAATLVVSVLVGDQPLLRLVVLAIVVQMFWQCLVFLRTDLYAVLVTATGCTNLWRVTSLRARAAVRLVTADERAELADASPRDLTTSAWFVWLWLLGPVASVAYVIWFIRPWLSEAAAWFTAGVSHDVSSGQFWWTLSSSLLVFASAILTVAVGTVKLVQGRRARRSRAGGAD